MTSCDFESRWKIRDANAADTEVRPPAAFKWKAAVLALLALAFPFGALTLDAADTAAFSGRWVTAEGDVIEFQTRESVVFGVLSQPSPEGLGRFFKAGAPIMRDVVTAADGTFRCTLREGEWKIRENGAAHTFDTTVIGGPAQTTIAGNTGDIVLRWQPILRRHFLDADGWFLRAEKLPATPPPITVTLRRAPTLSLFLVRGSEFEPAVALYYGVPYVAEFTTADKQLPLTISVQLGAGGEKLVVEAAAISDGAERRYRSKPFVLHMSDSGGLPPAQ